MTENKIYKAAANTFSPEYILNSPIGWKITFDMPLSEVKQISKKITSGYMHLNSMKDTLVNVSVSTETENMPRQIKTLLAESKLISNLVCSFTFPTPPQAKKNFYTTSFVIEPAGEGDYSLKY